MTQVSVVIASRDARLRLRACLEALKLAVPASSEVLVVDRGSTDGSMHMVAHEFGHVRLVRGAEELSEPRAWNRGIEMARGAYVLLLRPEVELLGETLRAMVAFLEDTLRYGAVVPRLLCPDGRVEPAHRGFPTLATPAWIGTPLARRYPCSAELRRLFAADFDYGADGDVDHPSIACLLMRRRALRKDPPFDERLAPHFYEVDLFRRLRGAGWRIRYLAGVEALDHAGQPELAYPELTREWHEQRLAYYRKHFGPAAGAWVKACVGWTVADHFATELRRRTKGLGRAPLWPVWQAYAGFVRH